MLDFAIKEKFYLWIIYSIQRVFNNYFGKNKIESKLVANSVAQCGTNLALVKT